LPFGVIRSITGSTFVVGWALDLHVHERRCVALHHRLDLRDLGRDVRSGERHELELLRDPAEHHSKAQRDSEAYSDAAAQDLRKRPTFDRLAARARLGGDLHDFEESPGRGGGK